MSELKLFFNWIFLMFKLTFFKTVSGSFKVSRQVSIERFMMVSNIKNLRISYVKPVKYGIFIRKRRLITFDNMTIHMCSSNAASKEAGDGS